MATAIPASSRGYRPAQPVAARSSQPMPAPITRVALAVKQNQILALQALQAAAASSMSSSSSSSSAGGSPPPPVFGRSSDEASVSLPSKRGRKFQACRAPTQPPSSLSPTCSVSIGKGVASQLSSAKLARSIPLITTTVPHWSSEGSHPLIDPTSGKRNEIYSLTNDRYPGAPGTALAKAREVQQKAIQAAKREAAKKLASKAELEHLGVKGLGKKRKSSSPYATVGNHHHNHAAQQPQPAVSSATTRGSVAEQVASAAMSRESSTSSRGRSSAKTTTTTTDNNLLTVPSSSTSRSRRPPSRASSPAPLTAQPSSARRATTRSGSAAPAEEDANGGGLNGNGNGAASRSSNRAATPSRGNSPPEGSKSVHSINSTAPFQSSPLAASSITMEPMLDHDDADATRDAAKSLSAAVANTEASPSAGRSSGMKRKASALSQEVKTDKATSEGADAKVQAESGAIPDDDSKRIKTGDATATEATTERGQKESSPSSVSSSRRTSPRMSTRRLASEAT
ncbi:hypothetical protein BCV70DRAFT_8213 [Testicularia cyperi]|uniref:Uncharacterized protein n=1 Tax=Testicularia cyperi TaxID=1882483 RepID=A0A317XXS1_9BASI|nr:hypothetical protein BCV70DRAFT_8213 [Testicularia cyperi]